MSVMEMPHTNGLIDVDYQPGASLSLPSVLQELLLALVGHDGDVFVRDGPHQLESDEHIVTQPSSCDMHLAADLHWISLADRLVAGSQCMAASKRQAPQSNVALYAGNAQGVHERPGGPRLPLPGAR